MPKIAVCGCQSSGKSSFIESYTRFPVAHIASDTGTRCPVVYELRSSKEGEFRIVTINGEVVQWENVPNVIGDHMRDIESSSRFSSKELKVKIISSDVEDIYFYDLPGFITLNPDQEESEMINAINANYVIDKSFKIVYIISALQNIKTTNDYLPMDAIMNSHNPKWKESAIHVVNKIDIYVNGLNTVKEANDLLKSHRNLPSLFYVSVTPDSANSVNEPVNSAERILANRRIEKEMIESLKSRFKDGWEPSNDQRLGLQKAHEAIYKMLHDAILNISLDEIERIDKLLQKETKVKESIEEYLGNIGTGDDVKPMLKTFVEIFKLHIQAIVLGKPLSSITKSIETKNVLNTWNTQLNDMSFTYDISEYGSGLKIGLSGSEFYLSKEEVFNRDPTAAKSWELKLLGIKSYERIFDYFCYVVLSKEMENMDDAKVLSISGGVHEFINVGIVTTHAATEVTSNFRNAINLFEELIKIETEASLKIVLDNLLTTTFSELNNSDVRHNIEEWYVRSIKVYIDKLKHNWQDDVDMFTDSITIDLPVRQLIGVILSFGVNKLVQHEQHYELEALGASQISLLESNIMEFFLKKPKGNPNKKSETNPLPSIWEEKHDLLSSIELVIKASSINLGITDYIAGGHASLPQMDGNMYNTQYLNSIAIKYYKSTLVSILNNLRARFMHYFIKDIQLPDSYLAFDILETLTTDKILESIDLHRTAAKKQKELIKSENKIMTLNQIKSKIQEICNKVVE